MSNFVILNIGYPTTDNSMGNNTRRFKLEPYPLYIRPDRIESMQESDFGEHHITNITIIGEQDSIWCNNSVADILAQINCEAICNSCKIEPTEIHTYCIKCNKEL